MQIANIPQYAHYLQGLFTPLCVHIAPSSGIVVAVMAKISGLMEPTDQRRRVWFEYLFERDVFAPAKVLELFAAINQLPEQFSLYRNEIDDSCMVLLAAEPCPRVERVLAKILVLPGLRSAREIAPPELFPVPERQL
ncbi:hypothetical protein [Hyphomonas sp.]|uniref:hypothetical protein n=1 Tax=Hyphomonas sp. TaxID=87 RepID=UPI00391C260E